MNDAQQGFSYGKINRIFVPFAIAVCILVALTPIVWAVLTWYSSTPITVATQELNNRMIISAERLFEEQIPTYPDPSKLVCDKENNPTLYGDGEARTLKPSETPDFTASDLSDLSAPGRPEEITLKEGDTYYCAYFATSEADAQLITITVGDTRKGVSRRHFGETSFILIPAEGWGALR